MNATTITLWRPVGPQELAMIEQAQFRASPPGLPGQPIFYPATTGASAVKIARDWNVPANGSGYGTRFPVRRDTPEHYKVEEAGGRRHQEYRVPAEDLPTFNDAVVGPIAIVRSFLE